MPLFTVKADVGVKGEAKRVLIKRSTGATEVYMLDNPRTDDVLVRPGDEMEFAK